MKFELFCTEESSKQKRQTSINVFQADNRINNNRIF
jgi:hypothetical protein